MSAPIVLAAGGTGGHLFPAQALLGELRRRGHGLALITDARGAEFDGGAEGVAVYTVSAATWAGAGMLRRSLAVFAILRGVLQARRILVRLRPSVVIGFGGYPALPTMLAALTLACRTAIHEQNAVLGRVNRMLAGRVDAIATSFAATQRIKRAAAEHVVVTGNPVRAEVRGLATHRYVPPTADGPVRLLVFGGSQGARIMSRVVPAAIGRLPALLRARVVVQQQCRAEDCEDVVRVYGQIGVAAEVAPFFADLPARMGEAHLVIARAGAGTVAELSVAARPAVLAPLAIATDDHQTANARALADVGAAVMMPEADFDPDGLAQELTALTGDTDRLVRMAAAAHAVARADAVVRLADLVERLEAA